FDKLENRNPLNESSYEQTEFLVDANAPTTTWTYTNPHYQDPVDHFMWITNQTKKQVTVMDTGCNPQGSGVSLVNWRVAKNINGSWMEVKRGTVHDNDINDTDGSPAHPVQGQSGGIWGIDSENRAYVFQDTNHNNTYDIGEPILSYDPDKDGFLAVPHRGDQGGLFALDSFQQPFIFQDTNNDFIYTNGDNIISYDPNHDAIPAQPQEGIVGGLYTFDDQSRPYTFAEFNGNWVVISSKPFGTGVGTINMSINISSDGEYHIYHQAIDTLGNMGPEYKEYVRVDDTPPVTINITGTPQYYRDTIFYITNQTPITIKTADQTPPCAVGVKYFHYEIWANNTKTFQKNVTLFDEETFTIQGEGSHEVRWYAEDILGNREKTHYQTYCVDDTPPVVIITHGDPLIPMQNYSWVNKSTSITVDAQNPGYCPFFTIKFRINRGVWHNITNQHPFTLTFSDECIYELDAMAWDVLNHIDRKIQLYYVDNTPPQISIIKPVNGWYTTGSPIAAIIPAIDQPNNNTPCDDELAVGISAGNPADAFLLDAFPSFQYILLDGSTCVYDSTQGKFLGNFIVPQNIPFGNGPVLFGTLISDDLGNVNNTLSKLHELFLQAAGDENVFNTLIQPLQNTHQIVYVGIDRTPPSVTIAQPQQGAMIGPNPVDITAYMQDDLSGIDAGTPCYVTLQGIPLGTLQYNPTIGGCAGTLPLPGNIDSGTDIPFTVTVSDIAGNIGQATILVNVTSSHTNTPPVGVIISPVEGKTYNHTLSVEVEAHDAETPTEDLQVVVEIDRQNDPPFTYTAAYSTIFKNFTVDIDITNYTNTSTLQVLAYVTDGSGSTVITPPVHCSVKSNITYDKWMTVGWNLVNLPSIGTNTSIPHVFRSILGDFNYVFDSSTWDNYKYGRPINTLTNTQAGVWYWVNMINATRFYLTETG
ncbi:MAG TPA: hypothetical protein VMT57_03695, partial [Candidatus Thermoplasmatota archaeon]|nr:hypothetical protein [Candidatus Thermoplasmatota archaeon]